MKELDDRLVDNNGSVIFPRGIQNSDRTSVMATQIAARCRDFRKIIQKAPILPTSDLKDKELTATMSPKCCLLVFGAEHEEIARDDREGAMVSTD